MVGDTLTTVLHVSWLFSSQYAWVLGLQYIRTEKQFSEPLATIAAYTALGFLAAVGHLLFWKGRGGTLFLSFLKGDYLLLSLLSMAFHLLFAYAISKMDVVPMILSSLLDAVFVPVFRHIFVAPTLQSTHVIALPLLLGGIFVTTTLQYDGGWGISFKSTVDDDIVGLVACVCARLVISLRGIVGTALVLARHSDSVDKRANVDASPVQMLDFEALNRRHLFAEVYEEVYGKEHRIALDRVFGSGLYTTILPGVDLRSTGDIHSLGEFFFTFIAAAVAAVFWPNAPSVSGVWDDVSSSLLVACTLGYMSVVVFLNPSLEAYLAFNTPNAFFIMRQAVGCFVALMCASFAFDDQWDRVKVSGTFFAFLGYGLVFYSLHTMWNRAEEEKDIEMIAAAQGMSAEEVAALKEKHKELRNEDFRVVLLQRVLSEQNLEDVARRKDKRGKGRGSAIVNHDLMKPFNRPRDADTTAPPPIMEPEQHLDEQPLFYTAATLRSAHSTQQDEFQPGSSSSLNNITGAGAQPHPFGVQAAVDRALARAGK